MSTYVHILSNCQYLGIVRIAAHVWCVKTVEVGCIHMYFYEIPLLCHIYHYVCSELLFITECLWLCVK